MNKNLIVRVSLIVGLFISAAFSKEVYVPSATKNAMDMNSTSSQYCFARSKESDNIVVFWESGFGDDPSKASGNNRVDINTLLNVAEKCYAYNVDTLKFVNKGSSVTDNYKLVIFLLFSNEWIANGSGEDEKVGSLRVNAAAANIPSVVAHEIGHCFQYLTGCDTKGGYRYGFGTNGSGGNGFWEQCAQWQSFKVYPEEQFRTSDFSEYVKYNHRHIIHEDNRYTNYFLPDYWTFKHDITFTGKLWRESISPEDPIETYKRLNSLTQEQFNDEIYEHGARLTTWDLPNIISYGKNYIDKREQVKLNLTSDNYWLIDSSVCIENYGYNSIKLNAPQSASAVTVRFKGAVGTSGFKAIKTDLGGWRFGFVALLDNGERVYSDIGKANMKDGTNPESSLSFNCPDNCSKLWLIVSGAPQEHWKHPWDDDYSNDEEWPYMVQFSHTNILGKETKSGTPFVRNTRSFVKPVITAKTITLPQNQNWKLTTLSGKIIKSGQGKVLDINTLSRGVYMVKFSNNYLKFLKR